MPSSNEQNEDRDLSRELSVLKERLSNMGESMKDHESRLRQVERIPLILDNLQDKMEMRFDSHMKAIDGLCDRIDKGNDKGDLYDKVTDARVLSLEDTRKQGNTLMIMLRWVWAAILALGGLFGIHFVKGGKP